MTSLSPEFSEAEAKEIASILHVVANRRRRLVLSKLIEWGECGATSLAEAVGLSRSALSQHLGKLRDADFVSVERGKIVLAEFGYGGKLLPSFPNWLIDGTRPSHLA
jgi:DNA-binding transcriptional ArsR family regulator